MRCTLIANAETDLSKSVFESVFPSPFYRHNGADREHKAWLTKSDFIEAPSKGLKSCWLENICPTLPSPQKNFTQVVFQHSFTLNLSGKHSLCLFSKIPLDLPSPYFLLSLFYQFCGLILLFYIHKPHTPLTVSHEKTKVQRSSGLWGHQLHHSILSWPQHDRMSNCSFSRGTARVGY